MAKCKDSVLNQTPKRSTPLWGFDLNDEMGKQKIGPGQYYSASSASVGTIEAGEEKGNATIVRRILEKHFL